MPTPSSRTSPDTASAPATVDPVLCRQLAAWIRSVAAAPGGGDSANIRPKLRDTASQLAAAADLAETIQPHTVRNGQMNTHERGAWRVLLGLGARLTELAGKPALDLRPIRATSEKKLRLLVQSALGVAGRSGCNRRHLDRAGVPVYVVTDDPNPPRRP